MPIAQPAHDAIIQLVWGQQPGPAPLHDDRHGQMEEDVLLMPRVGVHPDDPELVWVVAQRAVAPEEEEPQTDLEPTRRADEPPADGRPAIVDADPLD